MSHLALIPARIALPYDPVKAVPDPWLERKHYLFNPRPGAARVLCTAFLQFNSSVWLTKKASGASNLTVDHPRLNEKVPPLAHALPHITIKEKVAAYT